MYWPYWSKWHNSLWPHRLGGRAVENFNERTKATHLHTNTHTSPPQLHFTPQLITSLIQFHITAPTEKNLTARRRPPPTLQWEPYLTQHLTNWLGWRWNFHPNLNPRGSASTTTGGHVTTSTPVIGLDQTALPLSSPSGPQDSTSSATVSGVKLSLVTVVTESQMCQEKRERKKRNNSFG